MANVPTSSAVLLMHNPGGAVPIASAAGLSGQAAHALSYDSRTGEYEEKGGCEREPTERDRFLAEARAVGEQASRQLDYDSRHGRWAGKGAGSMGDCSFWGQSGPLSREEIERDMLACGGCFLKSVVSVDRRYASELGLDSKQAFQELVRGNWQDMMALAGAAERAEDVRWYACYHTDAENSLHVHIATWAPGGLIREGWHPSARATREQKALLYRDAYARVRHERNLERDYYRDLLPKLASAVLVPYAGELAGADYSGYLAASEPADDGFPDVDWDGLLAQNPDVVGWVRIEGTPIDYPVVQARPEDPQRYLSCALDGAWSGHGCPYVDSECAGASGRSVLVYGHNMIDGSMFSALASYTDQGFFDGHREILFMTPSRNFRLEAVAAREVSAWSHHPRVDFAGVAEVASYLESERGQAQAAGDMPSRVSQMFEFVCCSYGQDNGRTVVYAVEKEPGRATRAA